MNMRVSFGGGTLVLVVALVACSGSKTDRADAAGDASDAGGTPADSGADRGDDATGDRQGETIDGGCPADVSFGCALGGATPGPGGGVACSDTATLPECVGGQWRCRAGELPLSQCDCYGAPALTCSLCTPTGWSLTCPDGGTDG